jgi:flagellar biosynthesis protein FlhF
LSEIEKELQEIETPQEIIKEIFKSLKQSCDNRILCESKASFSALHNLMKKRLMISSGYEIKKTANPQVIILMGPTGVGKTTTIAKLAAQFCLNPEKQIKVCFFNIDFYKLGAKEQLQKYADIFRIALEDITTIESLDKCLAKHQNDDLIIVDTAGRSQYAYQDLDELKSYLNRIPNATRYLTMSSTSKYSDLKEIVSSFGHIGFDHIILTKTDETKTIGPAMGILLKANKSLAYITNGQQVPEDYSPADFGFFEEKLFHAIRYNNPRQVL